MKPEVVVRQADPMKFERVGNLVYELLAEIYPDGPYKRDAFIEAARALLSWSCQSRLAGAQAGFCYPNPPGPGRRLGLLLVIP